MISARRPSEGRNCKEQTAPLYQRRVWSVIVEMPLSSGGLVAVAHDVHSEALTARAQSVRCCPFVFPSSPLLLVLSTHSSFFRACPVSLRFAAFAWHATITVIHSSLILNLEQQHASYNRRRPRRERNSISTGRPLELPSRSA